MLTVRHVTVLHINLRWNAHHAGAFRHSSVSLHLVMWTNKYNITLIIFSTSKFHHATPYITIDGSHRIAFLTWKYLWLFISHYRLPSETLFHSQFSRLVSIVVIFLWFINFLYFSDHYSHWMWSLNIWSFHLSRSSFSGYLICLVSPVRSLLLPTNWKCIRNLRTNLKFQTIIALVRCNSFSLPAQKLSKMWELY